MPPERAIAAIDVGGTFTDAVLLRGGRLLTCKVPSTPDDPGRAVATALQRLGGAELLIHGTTVATNALLEGKLARVAFVTTAGFRDVLAIGRQNRAPRDLYSLEPRPRLELLPRDLRLEVTERLAPDGRVATKLTRHEIGRVVDGVTALQPEAVAVCLLHSYANPAHEQALGKALRKLKLPVVLSSELAPEFREFERSLVTAANAALMPLLRGYINGLERTIKPTRVVLMHSAGGWLPASIAAAEPVRLALSGPAGGIAAVRAALAAEGLEDGLAFDVGGTSTDAARVHKHASLRTVTEIAELPLRTPSLDIHTIGAGGGSIAYIDAGGALQVGPRSAGAEPGPACYGRGGKLPTLTDALVVLGRIPHGLKLGGELSLHPAAAKTALSTLKLGSATRAAEAVLRVSLASIERALRRVTVERHGVSGLPLVPFGGAGGALACDLAELMGTKTVIVPREPGLFCALGMLHTPASRDLSRTLLLPDVPGSYALAKVAADELAARARAELAACDLKGPFKAQLSVDVRYVGQSFELNVPLTKGWKRAFLKAHEAEFYFDRGDAPAEIVNIRVRVEAKHVAPKLPPLPVQGKAKPFGKSGSMPVYDRSSLSVGTKLQGPAIVAELSSCLFLKQGWKLEVTRSGQMLLSRTGAPAQRRKRQG